jgi:hypothetical protein
MMAEMIRGLSPRRRLLAAACVALASCAAAVAACDEDEAPVPADAAAGATCGDLFGTAPVFMPCRETADQCAFYTRGPVRTCASVCAEVGATCGAAYAATDACGIESPDLGCQWPSDEHICVCLKT